MLEPENIFHSVRASNSNYLIPDILEKNLQKKKIRNTSLTS